MSDAVHDDCIFIVTVCARDTLGMAMLAAAAPAAMPPALRNLRRVLAFSD
jgi:hypothetical protein